jgi:hypothetical protein
MYIDMKSIQKITPVPSRELAGALLRAVAEGDRRAVALALDDSVRPSQDQSDTGEVERLQLLDAVARRLQTFETPFGTRAQDPGVLLCMDLLNHLARRS